MNYDYVIYWESDVRRFVNDQYEISTNQVKMCILFSDLLQTKRLIC